MGLSHAQLHVDRKLDIGAQHFSHEVERSHLARLRLRQEVPGEEPLDGLTPHREVVVFQLLDELLLLQIPLQVGFRGLLVVEEEVGSLDLQELLFQNFKLHLLVLVSLLLEELLDLPELVAVLGQPQVAH